VVAFPPSQSHVVWRLFGVVTSSAFSMSRRSGAHFTFFVFQRRSLALPPLARSSGTSQQYIGDFFFRVSPVRPAFPDLWEAMVDQDRCSRRGPPAPILPRLWAVTRGPCYPRTPFPEPTVIFLVFSPRDCENSRRTPPFFPYLDPAGRK